METPKRRDRFNDPTRWSKPYDPAFIDPVNDTENPGPYYQEEGHGRKT